MTKLPTWSTWSLGSLKWWRHIVKVSLVLVIFPYWLTRQHLLGSLQRTGVIVVSPCSASLLVQHLSLHPSNPVNPVTLQTKKSAASPQTVAAPDLATRHAHYGLYRSIAPDYFRYDSSTSSTSSTQSHWPFIADIATTVQRLANAVDDGHSRYTPITSVGGDDLPAISWKNNRWCLGIYCATTTIKGRNDGAVLAVAPSAPVMPPPPPTGIWMDDANRAAIMVRYLGRASLISNRNLRFVLTTPATSILLALLAGLAFYYWNYTVDPSVVSKSFTTIVYQHEYYRAFTAATAHFEPVHLWFNGMALYTLGMELEHQMGSIPFLLYNVSLIPITTVIMMLFVEYQLKRTGNLSLVDKSVVGYSGVLFAWMVVASLHSDRPICPIPFFDDVCFHTYSIMGMRFNLGPVVQLLVAQVLLQRASFVGHLAGVVAGFALYWNLMPLGMVQPAVLIPILYCILLWQRQRQDYHRSSERDGLLNPKNTCSEWWILWRGYVAIVVVGFVVGLHWTLLLSLSSQTVLLHYAKIHDTKSWWKAWITSSILGVITDSMTLAGWFLLGDLYIVRAPIDLSFNGTIGLSVVVIYMTLRLLWQLTGIALACVIWKERGDDGGVFTAIFGTTVLESGVEIGKGLACLVRKPMEGPSLADQV
jgi:membrane associated rhomboid family serine protease